MNTIKKTATAAKNFVVRHKTAIAVTATSTVLIAVNRAAVRDLNEFLEESGQLDAFNDFLTKK